MFRSLLAACCLLAVGCNHANFDKDIVGVWENSGTPESSALPESLRLSPDWKAAIEFKADGTFTWELDGESGKDAYAGTYKVVGYSLDMTVTSIGHKRWPSDMWLEYTVRQQSTGAIQLPLPQDWTGPTVDYFKKN